MELGQLYVDGRYSCRVGRAQPGNQLLRVRDTAVALAELLPGPAVAHGDHVTAVRQLRGPHQLHRHFSFGPGPPPHAGTPPPRS